MATESEHIATYIIKTEEDENAKFWRKSIQGDKSFTFRHTVPPPSGDAKPDVGSSFPGSSSDRILNTRYQRATVDKFIPESLKYYKTFNTFTSAVTGGISGGPGGLARLLGIAGPVGTAAGGVVGVGAAVAERASAYRAQAAQASVYGLTPKQMATFANQFTDVLGEGGAPGLFNEVIKQQTTLGQEGVFRSFLKQYGRGAQGVLGKETTEDYSEDLLRAYQRMSKELPRDRWQTAAGAYGITPDINTLLRMQNEETTSKQLEGLIGKEREERLGDVDKETATAIKDFGKWSSQQLINLGTEFWKIFGEGVKGLKPPDPNNLPEGDRPTHPSIIDDIKSWFGGGNEANKPSPGATKQDLETYGGGNFVLPGMGNLAIPGSERVPQNIQDIRDAIVNDRGVASALTKSEINVGDFGGGGGVGTAPTYWSGGIGAAGEPRTLSRGATRGTDQGDISGTAVTTPGEMGKYRPVYKLGDKDLSDAVVNTIAGEAKTGNKAGVDAVIDTMVNRLGTKAYGPSGNLEEVARARGQFTGYRQAKPEEAAMIRERIKAIASGQLPDITGGANEYRASWYNGPWRQNHPEGVNIGGNIFARNAKVSGNPYAAIGSGVGGVGGISPNFVGSTSSQGGGTGHWADDLKKMKDNHLITNEQCVSLATAAVGIKLGSGKEGANVHDWRRGESVMGGDIKPGTPISTFLDRMGQASDKYAGGGSGTMGARLDHAAEFLKYLTDPKTGKRTGFEVLEQFSGSAPHVRDYYNNPIVTGPGNRLNPGFGENNAMNYSAIDVASGGKLGGANNPMVRDAIAKADANKARVEARMPARPTSTGGGNKDISNLNDMNMFQGISKLNVTVNNQAGATVHTGIAQMGLQSGSYNT